MGLLGGDIKTGGKITTMPNRHFSLNLSRARSREYRMNQITSISKENLFFICVDIEKGLSAYHQWIRTLDAGYSGEELQLVQFGLPVSDPGITERVFRR